MQHDLAAAVRAAGVVGAGGAGFPTHIKISARVDTVIANGAECEPLLRADQELMAVESAKVVIGLRSVLEAVGAKRGYIGLKQKYTAAFKNLKAFIDRLGEKRIELFFLPDFYPAGDEHVLVQEVTGRIVPEGGIPLHVGVVVANVETLVNIAQALESVPVTEKYLTVTGSVHHPVTLKAPIGTSIEDLIRLAGGTTVSDYTVIDGGPMMGRVVLPDTPVTKTTGGIIVLPSDHPLIIHKNLPWSQIVNQTKAVCCNCVACTDVCPRNLLGHSLEPHRIMQAIGRGLAKDPGGIITWAFLCSECGACDTYGCTMGLSPRRVNAELKRLFAQNGIKNPHQKQPDQVRQVREYRRIPTKRLIARLGLTEYDQTAPLRPVSVMPQTVRLLLSQHIGAPARPVVSAGDRVNTGDLIAVIPEGAAMGANLHASISGQVYAVSDFIGIRVNGAVEAE